MTAPLTWVVGGGGLLGSNVTPALDSPPWRPAVPLSWGPRFAATADRAVAQFAHDLAAAPGRPWAIYWCAGAGVVGTSAALLAAETAALRHFLEAWEVCLRSVPGLAGRRGQVMLASSAGGVYAGSEGRPFTDDTVPVPMSDYGRAKLEQERVLEAWAASRPEVSTLAARITNLYGPGQRLDKPQGLISHMTRCLIFGAPVHIYVSLDTIRDYLYAADAGRMLVAGMRRLSDESTVGRRRVVKIYGSGQEVSIAGLIGVFRSMSRRHLRVVCGLHALRRLQPTILRFRSHVWPDIEQAPTSLLEGIGRLHRHQMAQFIAGRLPRPR